VDHLQYTRHGIVQRQQHTFLGLPRVGFWFDADFGGTILSALSVASFALSRSEILQQLQSTINNVVFTYYYHC